MKILDLIEGGSNVSVMVNVIDLKEFFRECQDEWQSERDKWEAERAKDKELMTVEQVLEALKCSKPTLWRWDKTGYLKAVKIGRRVRYRRGDVLKVLEGRAI